MSVVKEEIFVIWLLIEQQEWLENQSNNNSKYTKKSKWAQIKVFRLLIGWYIHACGKMVHSL